MGNHVFGCDICQDVCPWNRRAPMVTTAQFQPRVFPSPEENRASGSLQPQDESLYLPRLEWLLGLSEADFRELFRGSAVKRAKWRGLIRNACIALGNSGLRPGMTDHGRIRSLVERLAESEDQVLAESARWALSRIQ
jgi:epoxyqueuosine reductase